MTKKSALKLMIVAIIILATFIPFGPKNMIVGISSLTLALGLTGEDYSDDKIKNLIQLLVVIILLCIGAETIKFNIYMGSITTLIVSFLIYYFYTYEHKNSKAMPFMMYYILLLTFPVDFNDFPLRLACCIYGAIVIFLIYTLILKVSFIKIVDNRINIAMDTIIKNIYSKINGKNDINEFDSIGTTLKSAEWLLFRKALWSSKNIKKLYIRERIIEFLVFINRQVKNSNDKESLQDIESGIIKLKEFYNKEIEFSEFYSFTNALAEKNKEKIGEEKLQTINLRVKDVYKILKDNKIDEVYKEHKEKVKKIIKKNSKEYNLGYSFNFHYIKFNLSMKGSILISLAVFLVYYFNIPFGRWMLYTIVTVYLPFLEQGYKKARDRVAGTIIGFIAFDIIFTITHSMVIIVVLIILSIYFTLYFTDYDKRAIFITFAAIAGSDISEHYKNYYLLSSYRLYYVILGAFLAYLVLKYIFPYDTKKAVKNFINSYKKLNYKILTKIQDGEKIEKSEIYELTIINNCLWNRGNFINGFCKSEELSKILDIEEYLSYELKMIKDGNEITKKRLEIDIKERIEKLDNFTV